LFLYHVFIEEKDFNVIIYIYILTFLLLDYFKEICTVHNKIIVMFLFSLYWIPTEFFNTIELARKSPQADIWAFSSTLWEVFNYGIVLPEVQNVELFKKVNIHLNV